MVGVWYAAVAAAFVLGLLFVLAYSRRGGAQPVGKHGASPATVEGRAVQSTVVDTAAVDASTEVVATTPEPALEPVRGYDSDAVAHRAQVHAETEALRHAAEAEAEATLRAARAEAQSATLEAHATRTRADAEAVDILAEARAAAQHEIARLTADARRLEAELAERDRQASELEARLDADQRRLSGELAELDTSIAQLHARQRELDTLEADLRQRASELDERRSALDARTGEFDRELERVAGLTAEQAKAELMTGVEAGARREAALLVRSIENEARAEGTAKAREIVVEAVQRVASEQTTETVVSVMHLPSDDMKGRIIGREGRNIRAYETVTGVNLIIDDTPEAVLLSCFDPVRREVGRLTLERLVLDGRIHPHRIEEAYEQSKVEVDELCLRAARDALADVGITDLDERLLPTLGRLKYRTSYGQNVLGHLIETAHIAGVMAAELGIEPTLVKRCAFLHDIGKALTHEVEGSHAIVGAELLRRYGEDEAVAHAVEAHHNEVQPKTIEAVLTQASDTCSAARPGARRESLEAYVKRLARIEEIATQKTGVDKVFAMQSGREVRVMVQPTEVDDLAASVLAREIAKQIEDELTYPGQIRVTVVRESRSTEIAH
jgi:ribonucrease Y